MRAKAVVQKISVLDITGTGGASKSSLTDELTCRLGLDQDDTLRIAAINIDPARRKSGRVISGDRIRMNAVNPWSDEPRVFMCSSAAHDFDSKIGQALPDVIAASKCAGIVVETLGIGRGAATIIPHADVLMYVMTSEFGRGKPAGKIDILDLIEFMAINRFDRKVSLDELCDVAKQMQRNREVSGTPTEQMLVFSTMAARLNGENVTTLCWAIVIKYLDGIF